MITLALLCLLLFGGLGVFVLLLSRLWTLEGAFVRASWLPLTALLLEGVFFEWVAGVGGYAAVAIPVLTCIASLFLGVIGATLVASARERGEPITRILWATLLASVPALFLVAYVLYASLVHASWSCA